MSGPLILGSTGQVGRALAHVAGPAVFQGRADAPVVWDILNAPAPALGPITGVVSLTRGPDTATEIALATAACDLGEARGVPVLIASSQAVYGPAGAVPLAEDAPCAPTSEYGRIKLAMEAAVAGRATCLRIGNVVGCDMLLMNAARGPVTLDRLPDGRSPRRAYIGPACLWQVITGLLAQDDLPAVINVAQPGLVEMADLLRAASLDWTWRDGAGALAELALDTTALQQRVPLPAATPAGLIAQARAAGWGPVA